MESQSRKFPIDARSSSLSVLEGALHATRDRPLEKHRGLEGKESFWHRGVVIKGRKLVSPDDFSFAPGDIQVILPLVAIPWKKAQRRAVDEGLKKHPVASGRCAALARIIHRVAVTTDPSTHGIQLVPRNPARFLVPKHPHIPTWHSHTLVTTHQHSIDAITGAPGHAASEYVEHYWDFHEFINVQRVDVDAIDPGIEGDDV